MRKVLVVDDSPDILYCHESLLIAAGFEVTACDGPLEALDALEKEKFDAVLTDYQMPKVTPAYFAALVASGLPVLMVTGCASPNVPAGIEVYHKWDHHSRYVNRLKSLLPLAV